MILESIRSPSPGKEGPAMSAPNKSSRIDEWILQKIYRAAGQPSVRLELRNSAEVSPKDALPVASIVIQDRKTLLRLLLDPEAEFGDAYSEGRVSLEGDLISALEILYPSLPQAEHQSWYTKLVSKCMEYVQRNSLRGSRRNIQRHYDLNTDFYELWLDPQLIYTCAYYPSPGATLEQAQAAKLDYVCRKVQLQPGERVVDAGCGWGALALHMAKNYGVTVRAFNVSREQILFARERAKELELSQRVEFIEDDYRNISGECDAFVSVGMLEHVGREHYRELGSIIHRSLAKTGRGLLHFIGRNHPRPFSTWTRKRIFPGAYAPALGEVMQVFEPWDLSVLDVENLRPHYAKTLEQWLARFENSEQQICEMFSPEFMRAWRLYLAGAVAGFRAGTLQLFQIVFARTACRRIPWTRAHLYTKEQHEE
jgi:cyclopropane-fatty-acyl-phospholipid synthase